VSKVGCVIAGRKTSAVQYAIFKVMSLRSRYNIVSYRVSSRYFLKLS